MCSLNLHKKIIDKLYISVGQVVGAHVFTIVLEHALWKTQLKYEEAAMIEISEDGVSVEVLFEIEQDRADLIGNEFVLNIVFTLGNLVGKQLAEKLTQDLVEI